MLPTNLQSVGGIEGGKIASYRAAEGKEARGLGLRLLLRISHHFTARGNLNSIN